MLNSQFADLGVVSLPAWAERQKYMNPIDLSRPEMEDGFKDYSAVVAQLCKAAGYTHGQAHVTVDEKIVQAGWSQRRPDAHVDGRFMPEEMKWGGGPGPSWAHGCNEIPFSRSPVIVAASIPGCIAYRGEFDGTPKSDGDLEHIRDQLGEGELLPAGRGFLLSPDCVHESVRFERPTKRTFLRIALPVHRTRRRNT